ncbi:plasmid stability protein [Catenulispora sp. MAP12-49]|uniref:type II toxin-antitoxin system VapB family antitoxin n=1 Tax=unclassified Catenulispora TaxID=414885 RepID=UPI00351205CB
MADLLVRDVPEEVMSALDAHAGRLGISRSEYVRRRLAADAALSEAPVRSADLVRFSDLFADLGDPDVMGQAWR